MAGKIYVAISSAVLDTEDGGRASITAGVTRVREGHPILRGRESMFKEIDVHFDIEDARSAPQDAPKPEPVVSAPAETVAAPATAEDEAYLPPAKKTAASRRGPRKA